MLRIVLLAQSTMISAAPPSAVMPNKCVGMVVKVKVARISICMLPTECAVTTVLLLLLLLRLLLSASATTEVCSKVAGCRSC
eukprot:COSAG06_NODE_6273_length_3002_cov_15.813286_2_plen_82_part_00